MRCGLEVCGCGAGAGKISQTPAGAGRDEFKFRECGAGTDKMFQPAQDCFLHNLVMFFEQL